MLPQYLQKTIDQLEEFITKPTSEHLFYRPIQSMPKEIDSEQRSRLAQEYTKMITNKLRPKYVELKRFLEEEYLPVCRSTAGFKDLPKGKETYDYL